MSTDTPAEALAAEAERIARNSSFTAKEKIIAAAERYFADEAKELLRFSVEHHRYLSVNQSQFIDCSCGEQIKMITWATVFDIHCAHVLAAFREQKGGR